MSAMSKNIALFLNFNNMKNIWTEKDIDCGLFIIKETSPKGSTNLSFAATVVYKVGFGYFGNNGTHIYKGKEQKTSQEYCLIAALTDGWVFPVGFTKESLVKKLNEDPVGYRPLTKEELFKIINNSTQGFY